MMDSKKPSVAIVIPWPGGDGLSESQKISLRHLRHFLGAYDTYLIAPRGASCEIDGIKSMRFRARYFGSAAAHGLLLMSRGFYQRFRNYEHLMFYHLDSLVFSDGLKEWCDKPYDYIGAPWFQCEDSPWVHQARVGNGGFAMLRVSKAIDALKARHRYIRGSRWLDLHVMWTPHFIANWIDHLAQTFPKSKLLTRLADERSRFMDPASNNRNNDIFWSDMAKYYLPEFSVAPFDEGLRFAFEVSPRECFRMNGGKMPFGCHAWERYDREFWEPHLLPS
jgi:hypothetical protein